MAAPKLLYIINHMDWFWSHRLPLAAGAQQAGYNVLVAATGAAGDAELKRRGFQGFDLPASPFKIIAAIHCLLRREQPAVMHAITIKYALFAGLAARLHPRLKVVLTIAGLGYLFSGEGLKPTLLRLAVGPFLRLALRHPRAQIIFQNPDDMAIMIRRGYVARGRCHLILGSGVDVQQFSPRPEPDNAVPVVVMPTRLVHDKGVAVFIAAASILKSRKIPAAFQIAGGVTHNNPLAISEAEMKAMIGQSGVLWLGKVADMPGLLAGADLIAYPSYYREGIPKVLLEAAAMGKAIVTTDHPGCREAVRDGENGLLVPVKNAAALADAVERLLRDPGLRRSMGVYARARAEAEFDVRKIVRQTLEVYSA